MYQNVNAKIASLRNGHSIRISGDDRCHVCAERSGDGKIVRFVRTMVTATGRRSEVIKTERVG